MGLSISASAAIIFIASVIVFGTLLGAFDNYQKALVDAQRTFLDRQDTSLHDRISIYSVDVENRTITIVNEGERTILLNDVDLLLNGTISNDAIASISVENVTGTGLWLPSEHLVITTASSLNATLIGIVTGNGVAAYH